MDLGSLRELPHLSEYTLSYVNITTLSEDVRTLSRYGKPVRNRAFNVLVV